MKRKENKMDRNTLAYSEIDTINTPRSTWNTSFTHKTTFNAGKLIVLYFDEDIIPGLTRKLKTSFVVRMQTPIYPTMDNLKFDYFWFKAPKYYYWEHFKNQMGQNDLGAWSQTIEYTTPEINVTTAYGVNDLAAYMGVPINITGFSWDRLGIGLYIDIWNNFFRSQALQAPIVIDKTDSDLNSDATINTGYGLLPVCRTHDYFSSLLPEPQRSLPGMSGGVTLPLGTTAPVVGNGMSLGLTDGTNNAGLIYSNSIGNNVSQGAYNKPAGSAYTNNPLNTLSLGVTKDPEKSGMIVDLTQATAASLNALYLATATQSLLQNDARLGTIYRDLLHQYGVTASSEATMLPEYLGGSSVPINIETVLQNSETSGTSPLGQTGAFSVTANVNEDFTKSFTTHDMLICVGCVRVAQHTYQQGLARQFKRQRRLDHYWPALAHIGNQPVYNYEIFLQDDAVVDANGEPVNNGVMGYKEAWQEYLYKVNKISGELLSTYSQSLDAWHYGDDYATLPVLDDQWIEEPIDNIDRTLAVQSSEANQFIGDFYFEEVNTAPIPINRIPGLVGLHY